MRSSSASMRTASPRPFIATSAPAAASRSRMPRPIPLVEPVTTATRPPSGLFRPADAMSADWDDSGMLDHRRAFVDLILVDLMDEDASQRIDLAIPGLLLDRAPHVVVAGLPAPADAIGTEIDVLGVVLAIEPRGQQPNQMHGGAAAIGRELGDQGIVAGILRQAR